MDKSKIKAVLQSLLSKAIDESSKKKLTELLTELDSVDVKKDEEVNKIPKPILKKIVDVVTKFFIKLAQHKAIGEILEELENLDIGP